MRKILSGFLATAMVTSVCATMSLAAPAVSPATPSEITVDFSKVALETEGNGSALNGNLKTDAMLTLTTDDGGKIELKVTSTDIISGMNPAAIVGEFAKLGSSNITLTGVTDADGNLLSATDIALSQKGSKLIIKTVATGKKSVIKVASASLTPKAATPNSTDTDMEFENNTVSASYEAGLDAVTKTADVEGSLAPKLEDIVKCDRNGEPMPLSETQIGVDKDQNNEGGIQSGSTVYFLIQDGGYKFDDDTYWKLKITKGDNGKLIKKISDTSKIFSKDLYNVNTGEQIAGTGVDRHRYIKVELNEIFTDDEYKMTLDLRLTPKSKAVDVYDAVDDDDELKVSDFYFYLKNIVKDADNDWKVGIAGLMLNPLENDWNEVTYYDEDGDLAFMKFFADSDVDKFYAKLSTKWEHADYASYFNDQDAFIFNFTGSPKISSTSRCDLQIYNPFVDDDGNETIDPSTAVIYQVIDGDLYDVTDSWKYEEGDNGDMAFTTRTRFLGTYIICEKPVEEAVSDETVPDELTPDTTPEAPEDTTPDNNGGGKAPANTGKYL